MSPQDSYTANPKDLQSTTNPSTPTPNRGLHLPQSIDDNNASTQERDRLRNDAFFASRPARSADAHHVSSPVSFFNPTRAHFAHTSSPPHIAFQWTSRNNRKGRHALAIDPEHVSPVSKQKPTTPLPTSSLRNIGRGIWRMCTVYPVWDISYDVATTFTFGSVIWVINAFFVWLPLVRPDSEFEKEGLYGGGITAFIGATVFEVGSVLLLAEAVNENRETCFGWALENTFSHNGDMTGKEGEGERSDARILPSEELCTHHHLNRANLVGKGRSVEVSLLPRISSHSVQRSWTWFPSMQDLKTHYLRELGFIASLTQLIAATIFWIAGLTALPGIYEHMSRPIVIVFYWTPQVIGGIGFIVSGFLFMIETQSRWYKPAFGTLGWWIGAWNLLGGIGFTLCPAFGYDESSWAEYQACLSTFWGSWAFLIGSVVQWYESLAKHPVEVRDVSRVVEGEK